MLIFVDLVEDHRPLSKKGGLELVDSRFTKSPGTGCKGAEVYLVDYQLSLGTGAVAVPVEGSCRGAPGSVPSSGTVENVPREGSLGLYGGLSATVA